MLTICLDLVHTKVNITLQSLFHELVLSMNELATGIELPLVNEVGSVSWTAHSLCMVCLMFSSKLKGD